jgi:hypothetical protein
MFKRLVMWYACRHLLENELAETNAERQIRSILLLHMCLFFGYLAALKCSAQGPVVSVANPTFHIGWQKNILLRPMSCLASPLCMSNGNSHVWDMSHNHICVACNTIVARFWLRTQLPLLIMCLINEYQACVLNLLCCALCFSSTVFELPYRPLVLLEARSEWTGHTSSQTASVHNRQQQPPIL